jgi:glycosyltransferase involved in cell wall biosynthesis
VALYRLFRQRKPQIVHTHSSKAGILGRIAAYMAGVPVIIHTFHGFGFTPQQKPKTRRLFVTLEKWCARLSTHLVFVSQDNIAEAASLEIAIGRPQSLIRSGIATDYSPRTDIKAELRIPDTARLVISVGNFKPQKNPMDLTQVAQRVLKSKKEVHFIFVGDGELRPQIEAWKASFESGDHVHLLGWRRDIHGLLVASNIFLLTSLWEGLPRSILEASLARLPVVAYAVNGVRDILEDGVNGFLIAPGQIDLAAEKILWLLDHPIEAMRMGDNAREKIQKEFNIDFMVRQQEALYETSYNAVPLKDVYETIWTAGHPPS